MGKFRSWETALKFWGYLIFALIPIMLFGLLSLFLLHVHNETFVDLYTIFNCNWVNLVQTIKGIGLIIIAINFLAVINRTIVG
ncbi:hypothetical protein IMAU70089_02891 [Lactiplantibacillus plantarum]|nr:hypothetical protein [Lactiplantibacillus plantarum]MCG0700637.1 hypothetical protein [Lactiplantibacillus plantarum]MCG0703612.1 hypothetical protein [Lactiplantibacillus plantarum]MCG0706603.1 hypothetical protein [Lactiplantibacillus plantarum]MCG0709498.1 hypothetical protein [Lactiplantibacillus plantarum]